MKRRESIADLRPLEPVAAIELQHMRRAADEPLSNSLIEQHHYLGFESCGAACPFERRRGKT